MCPAFTAPSSPFSVNDEIKIHQGSGLFIFFFLFVLVTFLFVLYQLFNFSFSLSSPLASSYLQVKKCWRETLVCSPLQVGASPSRHQNLPHGCSRHLTVFPVSLHAASFHASPCGVVHTTSDTHPATPVTTRAGARRVRMACSFSSPCAQDTGVQGNGR